MRESRDNVLVPAPSGQLSVVDCDAVDLDLDDAAISETESEGGHISFFSETGSSEGRSFQLSPQSMSSSLGKMSFVSRLDVIDDRDVTILANPRTTAGELIEEEVTETIDTTDMVPVSSLHSSKLSGSSPNQDADCSDYGKTSSGWSPLNSNKSPRSIDQCLAEQEELLRRMMLSASGMRHQKANAGSGSMGCGGGVQSARSRPDVTLYEG
jgi:hypothetical protein